MFQNLLLSCSKIDILFIVNFSLSVCGELDVLDILYTAGADLNTSDIHGAFPIHYAAQMCSSTCEMGVDSRVGLTSKYNWQKCILRHCIESNNLIAITVIEVKCNLIFYFSAASPNQVWSTSWCKGQNLKRATYVGSKFRYLKL